MKKKTLLLTIGIFIAVAIGAFIYFVANVSSVSDPIKKYKCSEDVNQFIRSVKIYASAHQDINLDLTDTLGSNESDYHAVYMTIGMKKNGHDITYRLMCETSSDHDKTVKTEVHLILAFDQTNKTGGYQANGNGTKPLIDYFESKFLVPFKNNQNIRITPL
jgi:hypothetical protein